MFRRPQPSGRRGRSSLGGFGVQRGLFEVLQVGCRLIDRVPGGQTTRGREVVAGGDSGQPASEAFQVGLGLLDLGVGRSATGTLLGQLLAQCRDAFEDLGVFSVAGGVELLDNGSFLDGIGEPHRQHTYSAALVVDPIGRPPNLQYHVITRGQQVDRLLQVQCAKRAQFAPYLHPKRARRMAVDALITIQLLCSSATLRCYIRNIR